MYLYKVLDLDKLDCSVALLKNVVSNKLGRKDIIKIDRILDLDWDVIGYVDPGITVNFIKDGKQVEKRQLKLPTRIKNVIHCKNPRCITSVEQELPQVAMLARRLNGKYLAPHCDHLDKRVEEIHEGVFEKLIEDLMGKPLSEIQELYNNRDIEA